jgi:hypothetical protein
MFIGPNFVRSNLASLLRECLGLSPPAIFMAVSILSQFVHRSQQLCVEGSGQQEGSNGGVLEKKDQVGFKIQFKIITSSINGVLFLQRELQELAGKLIDACATIAGSFLEQTTWLRRNFVVNSDLQEQAADTEVDEDGKRSLHHYAVQGFYYLSVCRDFSRFTIYIFNIQPCHYLENFLPPCWT